MLLCYGSHSEHRVIEASLASFKDHSDEAAKATTKGVKKNLRKFKRHQKFIKLFPEVSLLLIRLKPKSYPQHLHH